MKIGICDDDKNACDFIERVCKDYGYDDIEVFFSGKELLEYLAASSLDLLFLDIEMPEIDGILVKNLLEETFSSTYIIFCTSHSEVMQNAFGKNVIYFLSKPIHEMSIEEGLRKAAFLMKGQHIVNVSAEASVMIKNILYLSYEQKYTIFHICGGMTYLSHESMNNWLSHLTPYNFSAISRSYIVNLGNCISVKRSTILLRENISLKASRRMLPSFKKDYDLYQIQR